MKRVWPAKPKLPDVCSCIHYALGCGGQRSSPLCFKSFVSVQFSSDQNSPIVTVRAPIIEPRPRGCVWRLRARGRCCAVWFLWSGSLSALRTVLQRRTCSASTSGWRCPRRTGGRLAAETDTIWLAAGILVKMKQHAISPGQHMSKVDDVQRVTERLVYELQRGFTWWDSPPEEDLPPHDLLIMFKWDVPAHHVIQQDTQGPNCGRAPVVAMVLDPLWRTVHSCACETKIKEKKRNKLD